MFKISKKIISAVLCIALALGLCVVVNAQEPSTVTLCVEGSSKNMYFDTLQFDETTLFVADVIKKADEQSEKLTVLGVDDGYITSVNGESAGMFNGVDGCNGWDGWLVRVNGTALSTSIKDATVSDGDYIDLYYSDEYGVGMQYPKLSYADGVLKVVSEDTTYDAEFNPIVSENPVKYATVMFGSGTYLTDKNGKIKLDKQDYQAGTYKVQIFKSTIGSIPLVLRFNPNFTFEIKTTYVPETKITLNKTALTLIKGKTYSLKATLSPSNATYKDITFTSSNIKGATVSKSGVVKAISAKGATITATTKNGFKATCKVTVKIPTTKINVKKTNVTLKAGNTFTIKAVAYPTTNTDKVTFSTSNKKIATVSAKGIVKGIRSGKATIIVKSGKIKKTVKIKVLAKNVKKNK